MRSLLVGAALLAALIIAGCGGCTPAHSPLAPSPSVGIVLPSASPAPSTATASLPPPAPPPAAHPGPPRSADHPCQHADRPPGPAPIEPLGQAFDEAVSGALRDAQ